MSCAIARFATGARRWWHDRAAGGVVWAGDESGFFYLIQNDQWRPYQLRWHVLGSDPALDQVLYEESNPGFFLSLDESADGAFLFLAAGDHQNPGSVGTLPRQRP